MSKKSTGQGVGHLSVPHAPTPLRAIVKELRKVELIRHDRPHQIFTDWLYMLMGGFHSRPLRISYILKYQKEPPAEMIDYFDSLRPEIAESKNRLRDRYGSRFGDVWEHFTTAEMMLIDAASDHGVADWMGGIYAEWELHNHWQAQYFSPWAIAEMMARILLLDWQAVIAHRMLDAVEAEGLNEEAFIWHVPRDDAPERWRTLKHLFEQYPERLLPRMRPIHVLEPASGSGVMLLAAMKVVDPWLTNLGLIFYHGIDIDPICAMMTQIQLLLYGQNRYEHLVRVAMFGEFDVDNPKAIDIYEHLYDQTLRYVQCRNALELTPEEAAAWKAQKAAAAPYYPPKANGKAERAKKAAMQNLFDLPDAEGADDPLPPDIPGMIVQHNGDVHIERQGLLFDDPNE